MANTRRNGRNYRLSESQNAQGSRGTLRNRRKRKKNNWNFPLIGLLILIFIAMLSLIVWGAGRIISSFTADNSVVIENKLNRNVVIDEININGLTKQEALMQLEAKYPWSMTAKLEGAAEDTFVIENLLESNIKSLLDTIYVNDAEPQESYVIDFSVDTVKLDGIVAEMAKKWNVEAQNGSISGFDKATGSFLYSGEANGLAIDEEQLKKDIQTAISEKKFDSVIKVVSEEVAPEFTEAKVKEMYKVIGQFTTKTTANADRNTNIRIAVESMDGMIIPAGQEFSFNNTTGNRTTEKGYKPAGAYLNGVLIEEPGGGVCQVSSTLYNAVVKSGLKTTERHAHSFAPSYVVPGEDAMVSYDGYAGPDMRFLNTSHVAVAIRAKLVDQTLTVSIVGIPILEEGVEVSMVSKKIEDRESPKPNYVDDPSVPEGKEILVDKATLGSRWETKLVTKKDGVVIEEKFLHNSTYSGHPATIKKNPNSAPQETSMAAEAETEPTSEGETTSAAVESSQSSSDDRTGTTASTTAARQSSSQSSTAAQTSAQTSAAKTTEETTTSASKGPGVTSAASTTQATSAPQNQGPGETPTSGVDGAETVEPTIAKQPTAESSAPVGPGGN